MTATATAEPAAAAPASAFVGRQAVYDRQLGVYAYELLFRDGRDNHAKFSDGDMATGRVLLSGFMDIGLDRLCGRHAAFINLTRSFLVDPAPLPFPPDRVVLEVLETVEPEPEVIAGLERLGKAGYVLALDEAALRQHVARLKPRGLKLLAEKVETRAEFELLEALGFDYFQGYFLSRPEVVEGRRLPQNKLAVLQLLARLQDPDVVVNEVERAIAQDVSLSYRLLRCINSAFFSLPREVESIRHALVILGLGPLRRWIALLALADDNDQPTDVVHGVLVRARLCELLAAAAGEDPGSSFTAGLFSRLDLLMGAPLPDLLAELPLAPTLLDALLRRQGWLGALLDCVDACERCDWEALHLPGVSDETLRDAYIEATAWAFEVIEEVG